MEKYEKCVVCHQVTNVLKTTPIEERELYIPSAGQLCFECYRKLYIDEEPIGNGRRRGRAKKRNLKYK